MTKTNSFQIWHNAKCSKSRQTLDLLRQHHIEPQIFEYLKTPIEEQALKNTIKKLNITPRDLLRKKESLYQELQLDNGALTDDELIATMLKHPILIERPIVISADKAAIGRPPESVLSLLND